MQCRDFYVLIRPLIPSAGCNVPPDLRNRTLQFVHVTHAYVFSNGPKILSHRFRIPRSQTGICNVGGLCSL